MEPMVFALLAGIAAYVLVIALIPKRFIAGTDYTQSALSKLELETSDVMGVVASSSVFRDQVQSSSFISRVFLRMPWGQRIYSKLLKAGLGNSVDTFILTCLCSVVLLTYIFSGGGIAGVLAAFSLTFLGAWMFVKRRIAKRNTAFLALFPDALDMIVRSVRSGYPLNAAVRMVSDNMQAPVSTEFKQVADETSYGSSLIEALQRLSYRIDEPDIRFFVVVLSVQQEVGGNLAEVLSNLSAIIRKRKNLHLKIRALSSEGRATAWVLGLLPVFEFIAIYLVSPGHLTPLFATHLGNVILLTAIGIVLLGVFIVRQMINIEV